MVKKYKFDKKLWTQALSRTCHSLNFPAFLKGQRGGLTLPKIPRKGVMEKLLKGKGNPKKGGFCRKGGMLLVWVFFSSWGVANVTTFN